MKIVIEGEKNEIYKLRLRRDVDGNPILQLGNETLAWINESDNSINIDKGGVTRAGLHFDGAF